MQFLSRQLDPFWAAHTRRQLVSVNAASLIRQLKQSIMFDVRPISRIELVVTR